MTVLSVIKPQQKRRRYSHDFKAQIVAECFKPDVSVSRIALDNGLNANVVRRWMREARGINKRASSPAFVPLNLPAAAHPATQDQRPNAIRIEISRPGTQMVVEWPTEQSHQCVVLLRELLS